MSRSGPGAALQVSEEGSAWELLEPARSPQDRRAAANLLELARVATLSAHTLGAAVDRAGQLCAASLAAGGKVLACGNGGSAADAQHFVAELIGRMGRERAPLAALSLTVDPSVMTCIANDYGYESVFARQVAGLARPGDVLVALSTSGRSPNVIAALREAHRRGVRTVALVGESPAPQVHMCDVVLDVPSRCTARVQEIHAALLHSVCEVTETLLFDDPEDHPWRSR